MNKVCLVEIIDVLDELGTATTLYWSNGNYVTQLTDTPSNQYYNPIILGDIVSNESISIDSTPNISFSDIKFIADKIYLDYIWKGRVINVYYGSINDLRSAFNLIFTGVIENIDGNSYDEYQLKIADKMELLNKPITETILDNGTENEDILIPLSFGELANISPLLTNPATHEYQVHQHAIESFLDVRDYGYPIPYKAVCVIDEAGYTADLATSKILLCKQPAGTITCSVQGDKRGLTYLTTIDTIIAEIVKNYGGFTDSDIDLTSFSTFATGHTQQVAIYLDSKENILNTISYLADSVEAQIYMTRLGELSLFQLDFAAPATKILTDSDIKQNSIVMTKVLDVKAGIKLNYCQNNLVQQDLQTGITTGHKDLWAKEWLTVSDTDTVVAAKYNLETEVEPIDVALINKAETQAEATRRLAMWKTQHFIYSATYFGTDLTIGQVIEYGGNNHTILGLDINWSTNESNIEVII